jgi:hypothetical protein
MGGVWYSGPGSALWKEAVIMKIGWLSCSARTCHHGRLNPAAGRGY